MPSRMPPPARLVAVLSCAALLTSCAPDRPSDEPAVPNNMAQEPPRIPVADPPLDREQLLLAAIRAASAFAAGHDDSEAQRRLDGKRFELRLRFGCGEDEGELRGWRFDESNRTLRLRVTPDISKDDPIAAGIAGEGIETVEGFWVRRPWLLTASCPVAAEAAAESAAAPAPAQAAGATDRPTELEPAVQPAATARRVGLAQFFTAADSRTSRRQKRPYETTKVLDEKQMPSRQGYDFVLSGRLRALSDRRVIACTSDSPDAPPACLISVHVDRAWIERPDNRALIAEWTGG